MTDPVPGGLHPNLARIAAAYDIVLEEMGQRRLTPQQARDKIAALEARDDNGTRWCIDADTGRWVRYAADGTHVFDTPPSFGYATHDAFAYTHPDPFSITYGDGPRAEDPNARLELFSVQHDQLPAATQDSSKHRVRLPGLPAVAGSGGFDYRLLVAVVVVLLLLAWAL